MYESLFTPIKIGNVTLKNRLVMPAMHSNTTTAEHTFSEQSIAYLAARAKGGFGLVIPEFLAIDPSGYGTPNEVGIFDDRFLPNLQALVTAVHEAGGKICAQLHHSGIQTKTDCIGMDPLAVSAVPSTKYKSRVHELTVDEIHGLIERYIDAADRARRAGFDFVEVHGAHGYQIEQFLSKATNKRCDEYGGSYKNRARFAVEIIRGIRERCPELPILFRMSANEYMVGGNTPDDAVVYARLAEEAGANAIHISNGSAEGGNIISSYYFDPGFNVVNATKVKNAVSIPVICVGRINDPDLADEIVASGKADLVSLGRQSVCDSEFPKKLLEGRDDEIIHCSGCMQRCAYMPGCEDDDKGISCILNPFSGKESRWHITEAETKKRVAVIGGGVAGLEAAWVLARRGHSVALYEKEPVLGGQFRLAAVPPKKQDLGKAIHTYTALCRHYGVQLHCGTEVTAEQLKAMDVDAVVLSTGAEPIVPRIPGLDTMEHMTANSILRGENVVTGSRVLMVGGGLVGCECAEFLNTYGNHVDIVDMLPDFANGMQKGVRAELLKNLCAAGTAFYPNTKVLELRGGSVVLEQNGETLVRDGYDKVVLAVGSRPVRTLEETAKEAGFDTYVIGDAAKVRDAKFAIYEAAKLGITL